MPEFEITHNSTKLILWLKLQNKSFITMKIVDEKSCDLGYYSLKKLGNLPNENDFIQHSINNQGNKGIIHTLHDFIISNRENLGFEINDIYSTNTEIDSKYEAGLILKPPAVEFWNKRVKSGRAIFNDELGRYKIVWESKTENK